MKAQLIYNPTARGCLRREAVQEVVVFLGGKGWNIRWRETKCAGHATHLARRAADDGLDVVVVVGGDGTINEAINGLAGTDVALGVVPGGLTNVWALEMGIPVEDVMAAGGILAGARTRRIDLGQANDRYFILAAGVGFDALVARELLNAGSSGGKLSYVLTALRLTVNYEGARVAITIDGKTLDKRTLYCLLANLQLYGGAVRIAARAKLDDGLLDAVVFEGRNMLSAPTGIAYILSQGRLKMPGVEYHRARRVEVHGPDSLPVHVDGEFLGQTPMAFRCVPQCLRVIVPAKPPVRLFENADP